MIAFFAFVPFLLILYYKKVVATGEKRNFGQDLYTSAALVSLLGLFLGSVYYYGSYAAVLSGGPRQPVIATGVIKVGETYLPMLVLFWGFLGAWFYIIQDFIRRIRDDDLSSLLQP